MPRLSASTPVMLTTDIIAAGVDLIVPVSVVANASSPPASSTSNAIGQASVGTSASTILAANPSRKGCRVINSGTTKIQIGLGQNPTSSNYHVNLAAGGTTNDGAGGVWDGTISGVVWTGSIAAISSASGGLVNVTELT